MHILSQEEELFLVLKQQSCPLVTLEQLKPLLRRQEVFDVLNVT